MKDDDDRESFGILFSLKSEIGDIHVINQVPAIYTLINCLYYCYWSPFHAKLNYLILKQNA